MKIRKSIVMIVSGCSVCKCEKTRFINSSGIQNKSLRWSNQDGYSVFGPFMLKKEENQKIFIKINWKKVCFQRDIANEDFKDLPRRTASERQHSAMKRLELLQIQHLMVYKCFDKKYKETIHTGTRIVSNEVLT